MLIIGVVYDLTSINSNDSFHTSFEIFGSILDPLEVSAQNDRLQHELDQTKMENKNLTHQMHTWKEQLLDIGNFWSNF